MRDVAIVSFSQLPSVKVIEAADEPELVQPVTSDAMKQVGLTQDDIGFTCSGSTDYLPGRPFSFVAAVDGLKAWPPIRESHVEMDGRSRSTRLGCGSCTATSTPPWCSRLARAHSALSQTY